MSRKCEITKVGPMSGNNVSHSQRKTRRVFRPNVRHKRMYSETLGSWLSIKLSPHGMKVVESKGGIDAYLIKTKPVDLTKEMRQFRRELLYKLQTEPTEFGKALLQSLSHEVKEQA